MVARKQNAGSRTKVKTGCTTCRIRKVKCDELKPSCRNCVGSGRTCDGYESRFILFADQRGDKVDADSTESNIRSRSTGSIAVEITSQDVDLLSRYLSTKTLFNVKVGCDEEARQILQASLTDPSVCHAVMSLRALREDIEMSGDGPAWRARPSSSHRYGLSQYGMALGSLASNLSSPSSSALKSALLCCQIFVSIEQVRKNYTTMAQHIVRGLRIMHAYRARPSFNVMHKLIPAHHGRLPLLDVFIIKLFVAPCKFVEPPATTPVDGSTTFRCPPSPYQQQIGTRDVRTIAPNMRMELTRIGTSTLGFLDRVSQVESTQVALQLVTAKEALLNSLKAWLIRIDLQRKTIDSAVPEPISKSFLRFFHRILTIILLGALESSPDLDANLQAESDRLHSIAETLCERLKDYIMCSGIDNGRQEPST